MAALETSYLRDRRAIDSLDLSRVMEEMAGGGPGRRRGGTAVDGYDHVVLTRSRGSEACLGLLAAWDAGTAEEPFVWLGAAATAGTAREHKILGKMIAMLLLRACGNGCLPRVLAARTSSLALREAFGDLAARVPAASVFPALRGEVVTFTAAALARRLAPQVAPGIRFDIRNGALCGGRVAAGEYPAPEDLSASPPGLGLDPSDQMLAVLDLRRSEEHEVVEQALRIYRRS